MAQGWNAPWCLGFVAMFDHLLDSLKVTKNKGEKTFAAVSPQSMEMFGDNFGDLLFHDCNPFSIVGIEEGLFNH